MRCTDLPARALVVAVLVLAACGGTSLSTDGSPRDVGARSPESDAGDGQPDSGISGNEDGSANDLGSGADGTLALDGGEADAGGMDSMPVDMGPFVPATHPPFPLLVNGTKGVFPHPRLVSIVAQNETLSQDLFTFADQLIAGAWWTTVGSEYGVGTATKSVHITGPAITSNPTAAQMEQYIDGVIQAHPEIAVDGHSIYMLYLPDGIVALEDSVTPPQPNTNCKFYAGYHTMLGNGPDNWAYGQRCTTNGSGMMQLDTLTETASHEIMESATDPVDGFYLPVTSTTTPWVDEIWAQFYGGVVEDGDLCNDSEIREGRFLYQRMYSNRAAQAGGDPCVPAIGDPYYNTSAPKGWYTITPGGTVHIPITGWSSAPVADWLIDYSIDNGFDGFTVTLTSSTTTTYMGNTVGTLNNGKVATLSITAPANAQSRVTFLTVEIDSFTTSTTGDKAHFWPVGVYVP